MSSVSIHPPKTPVTKGSHGISKATIPNVCKMPGPPAPFVPSPLPNIAKSELSPKGYSTTVEIEGNAVAIRGATFESMGDIASKGTGGGLISANTHGPAKFITPGSLTVKIEGKNVHLLGEPMLNNCGPSGSPPNTGATMTGLKQAELTLDQAIGLICQLMCECRATAQAEKFETPVDPSAFAAPNFGLDPGDSPTKAANQKCVERKFNKDYKNTNLKAEQSYDTTTKPPTPVPGRPSGSSRPDFVRVKNPARPATGRNVDVIECKFPPDSMSDKQKEDYRKIGGNKKPIVLEPGKKPCAPC
jgi:uncharacterized Zn-binding protein involved in type VI secretion